MIAQVVEAFKGEFGSKRKPVRRNPWPLCLGSGRRGHRVPALCDRGCGFCPLHCPGPPACEEDES